MVAGVAANDDEGGLRVQPQHRAQTPRAVRHPVRQLAGKAVLDGGVRLAVLPLRIRELDSGQRCRSVHRRLHHPGRTAMVFVWSYLSDGDPAYTLVQVPVNDLIMLALFAPIVRFPVAGGASSLHVAFMVLLYSVIIFIVVPLKPACCCDARSFVGTESDGSRTGCCPDSRRSAWRRC